MKEFYKKNKTAITLTLFMFIVMLILSSLCFLGALMEGIKWLQIIFTILIPTIFFMVLVFFARKGAYEDMKITKKNELAVESGKTLKLSDKLAGFFYLKGYLAGLIVSLPLIILVIIYYCLPELPAFELGVTTKTLFYVFWGIVGAINPYAPFGVILYGVPVLIAFIGVPYHLFGLKLVYQRRELMEEKQRHEAFSIEARNKLYGNKQKEETDESNSGEV